MGWSTIFFVMDDLLKKLLILRTPGVGPVKYNALLEKYGDIDSVVASLNLTEDFKDSVKHEIDVANELGIKYIFEDDSFYPMELLKIKNHPVVISVRGNIETLRKRKVAVVGTRHSTASGMGFVSDLSQVFAKHGYAVVSGMAMGTDSAAHVGALKSDGNTQTIAVVAGGVDYIWPIENESLYYEIIERGCVISEMPVGLKPNAQNFVQRNRWVAGLCDMLIISEADLKSGSMPLIPTYLD